MVATKPRVLITGGMTTCTQAVVNYLVPRDQEPLVSFLRVADKYLVDPPTTYVGGRAAEAFKKPFVEYMQANLVYPERVEEVFTPPPGHPPFDIVFDLTGEVRINRNDDVYYETTGDLAKNCGLAAVRSKVKAYVRLTHPFYTCREGQVNSEADPVVPDGSRGYWWHESLRALANIPGLPLVILRIGASYGPQQLWGTLYSRIITGRVYQFTEGEMKYMWKPNTLHNTVHTEDISRVLWDCAAWMIQNGRQQCIALAGERLPHFAVEDAYTENLVRNLVAPATTPVAPMFDLVDDGNTTYQDIGNAVSRAFNIRFSFISEEETITASFHLNEMAQEVNDHHAEAWSEMIENSNPPVPNTPLTPYIDLHKFERRIIALPNTKVKRVLGITLLHPVFDDREVLDIVDSFIEEGTWPI